MRCKMKAMNLRSALGLGIVCVGLAAGAPGRVKRYLGLGPELKLDYSAKDHKGFDHVITTVVRGGRAVPFTDWPTAAPK
jgi:hypothetical protein